jgi:hypothetical protein
MIRLLKSILLYEIKLPKLFKSRNDVLGWLNSRKPLSQRIREYNRFES